MKVEFSKDPHGNLWHGFHFWGAHWWFDVGLLAVDFDKRTNKRTMSVYVWKLELVVTI